MNAGKLVFAFAHPLLLQLLGALLSRGGLRGLKFRLEVCPPASPLKACLLSKRRGLFDSTNWHCVLGIRIIGACARLRVVELLL